MESQRVENEKAAKAAMAKFDEAARRATVSAERACSTYLSRALPTFSPRLRGASSIWRSWAPRAGKTAFMGSAVDVAIAIRFRAGERAGRPADMPPLFDLAQCAACDPI